MSTSSDADKDREVMPTALFLDHTTKTYLVRKRLTDLLDAKQHWAIVITTDYYSILEQLNNLHVERCGDSANLLVIPSLPRTPIFVTFPRAHLNIDELIEIIDCGPGVTAADIEKHDYILLTSEGDQPIMDRAITNWIHMEHLAN